MITLNGEDIYSLQTIPQVGSPLETFVAVSVDAAVFIYTTIDNLFW